MKFPLGNREFGKVPDLDSRKGKACFHIFSRKFQISKDLCVSVIKKT
jgi:hypothetical protein